MENLFGLPAHPLLVHVPVVLVPLAAIGAVAMAVRQAWMRSFGWVVTALAGVGFLGTLLAASSGEELEERREASGQTISKVLQDHGEMGEAAEVWVALFFALVLAWVVFSWWRRRAGDEKVAAKVRKPKAISIALMVLALASSAAATVSITATGHNGAKAVWDNDAP